MHCRHLLYRTLHRQQVHTVFRLADPAAEEFQYPVSFDVRDLVTLEDVVEECQLGPNGCVQSVVSVVPHYCVDIVPSPVSSLCMRQGLAVLYGIFGRESGRMAC